MLGRPKKKERPGGAAVVDFGDLEIDPETKLMGPVRFEDSLQKEIARGLRYGSRCALALFQVGVAERPALGSSLPSPAKFVAQVLRKAARKSDLVARVSPTQFAVLLVEAEAKGATHFAERVRTGIGSHPYARRPDGSALFARAWVGVASWQPSFDSVGAFAGAAERALASTFRGFDAPQDWFREDGANRPFSV